MILRITIAAAHGRPPWHAHYQLAPRLPKAYSNKQAIHSREGRDNVIDRRFDAGNEAND
ncbi:MULTISPECIES: hypothetical protein [Pseudomonas]|uniref:hypothetical protein n=1 Tax=Pseudomonas TaxID=286 RepID=UPI001F523C3D|nr:hypothetical protein [Pseudomonas putida]MCI0913782.1 hypothetical protein [Pseudomonas putida]WAC00788.1 hypothetical protein OSW16_12235 [Pseudomonas putida]